MKSCEDDDEKVVVVVRRSWWILKMKQHRLGTHGVCVLYRSGPKLLLSQGS